MKRTLYGVKADPKAVDLPVFTPDPKDLDRKFWWADGWWSPDPYSVSISPATAWFTWALDSRLAVPWESPAELHEAVSKADIVTVRQVGEALVKEGVIEELGRVEPDGLEGWLLGRGPLVVESDWTQNMGRPDRGGLAPIVHGGQRTKMAYVANGLTRAHLVRIKTGFGRKFGYRGFIYVSLEDFKGLVERGHAYAGVQ